MVTNKEILELLKQLENHNNNDLNTVFTNSRNKHLQKLSAEINNILLKQRTQKIELKESEEKRKFLITNISHDLKTPLTVVNGLLEQTDFSNKSSSDNSSLVIRAREKLKETENVINNFFDLTKLEEKNYKMKLKKIAINELLRQVSLQFYDTIQTQKLEIHIEIPEKSVYVLGNRSALTRVFNNLISNAIKYGSDGNLIGIGLKSTDKEVRVTVWDRGKGISEKYYDDVFERLFTLEDSRNKDYSGSGLGLSITKRLVHLQGGEISLKSKPNHYTEFKVTLPNIEC